jgi:hypothetical protein
MNSKFITFDDYKKIKYKRIGKSFMYVSDIKYTLDRIGVLSKKQQQKKKKKELETLLFNFYDNISKYYKNIDSIILIQRYIRKYQKENNVYGPGIFEKSNNECDFYTFTAIEEIPKEYLFSYRDNNNFIYSFDIRSFEKLLTSNSQNPYNREDIPKKVINLYNKRLKYIKNNDIIIEPFEEDILSPEQIYKNRVLKIFQTIDFLNTMAGGTNPNWFHNLTIIQLKAYYKVLEDIWNYRAELTAPQKYEIVKNKKMFNKRVNDVYYMTNEAEIREIILKELETLLFTSSDDVHRATASYYILIAFVEISTECAQAMPWLIQY